jgi:hypothetical protein
MIYPILTLFIFFAVLAWIFFKPLAVNFYAYKNGKKKRELSEFEDLRTQDFEDLRSRARYFLF